MSGKTLDVVAVDRVLQLHRVRTALRTLKLDEFFPQICQRGFWWRDRSHFDRST